MKINLDKKNFIKALVFTLELLAIILILYLIFLPFYPLVQYKVNNGNENNISQEQKLDIAVKKTEEFKNAFPESEYAISPNRLIIPKIGVNAPIIESKSSEYGLSKGAWHMPDSSTPENGGNTVITGHRFKYLPPNNLTFYLFDKLKTGDVISVIWKEKEYYYTIKETKIVPKTDTSILGKTKEPILTLFTCHPLFSEENRLVVIAVPIK